MSQFPKNKNRISQNGFQICNNNKSRAQFLLLRRDSDRDKPSKAYDFKQ
jgi:hypothetical protein